MVGVGNPNVRMVATLAHFAPKEEDIENAMESRGMMRSMLKSRTGICGSVGRNLSYQSFTSCKVADLIWKVSFSAL